MDSFIKVLSSLLVLHLLIKKSCLSIPFVINSGGLSNGSIPGNNGRITKEVAQTLLADVYFTMSGESIGADNYSEAAEAARRVINSGVYPNRYLGGLLHKTLSIRLKKILF